MLETGSNWAGNYTYRAARIHYPETLAQVQALVRRSHKLKVLGSRHSFNDIADSPGDLISLTHFDPELVFDRERHTVTVPAGVTYSPEPCVAVAQAPPTEICGNEARLGSA